MTRLLRLGKAVLALVGLAVLLVAAPVLLASFGIPIGEVLGTFGDELASDAARTEALLVAVLATLGWVCWLMVLAAIVVEAIATIRGTVARPLPLLPGIQPAVRALLSAVTLASTVLPGAASAATTLPPPPVHAQLDDPDLIARTTAEPDAAATAAPVAATGPTYVVERGDTWWSIAETVLGSGSRWSEIVEVNLGYSMVDGTTVTADSVRPRPRWTLALPQGAVLPLQAAEPTGAAPIVEVHVVEAGDSLWDIAETYVTERSNQAVADAVRAIADANDIEDPNVLSVGQQLVIPDTISEDGPDSLVDGPNDQVVVESGDTLWDLASEHLGDGERYDEIVDLNAGVPQTDGAALVDPNLIEPGWILDLPTPVVAQPEPADQQSEPPEPLESVDAVPSPEPAPAPSPPVEAAPAPTPTAPPASVETTPAPAIDQPDPQPRDIEDVDDDAPTAVPVGLLGAGLTAAGVVVMLERRRRLQRQRRPRGHLLPSPPRKVTDAEIELRAAAPASDLERVMAAVQAAGAGSGIDGLPPVRYVTVSDTEVCVALVDERPAPSGFTSRSPDRWVTTEPFDALVDLAGGAVDPLPLLCPIGTTADGVQVLVDLERHGAVAIAGDPEATIGLLRAMALAMATVPWAAAPQLTTVGLAGEICGLPWVTVADTLNDALASLDGHSAEVSAALPHAGASLAQARASGATPDLWNPAVVVSAEPPWDAHQPSLADRVTAAPDATAVVVPAPSGDIAGSILLVDEARQVSFDGLDVQVVAACLSSDDLRVVGALLAEAERTDTVPAPQGYRPAGVRPSDPTIEAFGDVDILVRVMGTVAVDRLVDDHHVEVEFARSKSREAVVFMACGEDGAGVTADSVEAALWPAGANSRRTFNNTVTEARRALGESPGGARYLPNASEGRYRISERVTTDFELFWATVELANNTEDAAVAADLLAQALSLVRGEPFTGVGLDYAWTAPTRTAVQTAVIDVADELGEMLLAGGDLRGAERAARSGLLAAPGEERLYRLLMRAAAASGSRPMVERIWRELRDVLADPDHGIEPEGTMSDETIALFGELTGGSTKRRSA